MRSDLKNEVASHRGRHVALTTGLHRHASLHPHTHVSMHAHTMQTLRKKIKEELKSTARAWGVTQYVRGPSVWKRGRKEMGEEKDAGRETDIQPPRESQGVSKVT